MHASPSREIETLIDWLGPADVIRVARGVGCWMWAINEEGDGIALARSATAGGLVEQARQLLSANYGGRKFRTLIVAPQMCGNRRFHERPDILEIGEAVDAGWCRWLAVRDIDRISRTAEAVELLVDYLRASGVELFVTSWSTKEPFEFTSSVLEVLTEHRLGIERLAAQRNRHRTSERRRAGNRDRASDSDRVTDRSHAADRNSQ